ncbi:hypothetical protein BSM4216_0888 [Bacillus smithii]|nr:hypothetical protein BSM4216_0888 [Bacillus smithii]
MNITKRLKPPVVSAITFEYILEMRNIRLGGNTEQTQRIG